MIDFNGESSKSSHPQLIVRRLKALRRKNPSADKDRITSSVRNNLVENLAASASARRRLLLAQMEKGKARLAELRSSIEERRRQMRAVRESRIARHRRRRLALDQICLEAAKSSSGQSTSPHRRLDD